ncbi:MAG TPA: hypothetical protein VJ950_12220 [Acidimicrobiia bacterium]|nr:hypothetical protein [Acidimicrobiia bacterium]
MRVFRASILILTAALVACGGDGGTDTTLTETTTTVVEDGAGTVDFDDMPQECIDALVGYLQAIEPAVEDVDFDTTTGEDLEAMGTELEGLSEEYTTAIEDLDCPDPSGSDEEAFAAIIELAQQEAPGTVGYLQWVQGLAAGFGDAEVSGDCETDISALRAIIDENSSMSDLTMTEVVQVGSLVASVSTACTPDRAEEFFAEPDVAAFLESQ